MSEFEDPYLYPGSDTLRNRLGILDAAMLDETERELVAYRIVQGAPGGGFDLAHLRAIHRHLFQDVYEWAGALRTVEIAKGGNHFIHRRYIETAMADVHRRLKGMGFLRKRDAGAFAVEAARVLGDVNYVHPFREGNGRTQMEYLRQLALRAGHRFEPGALEPGRWIDASRASHEGDYGPMGREIAGAIG